MNQNSLASADGGEAVWAPEGPGGSLKPYVGQNCTPLTSSFLVCGKTNKKDSLPRRPAKLIVSHQIMRGLSRSWASKQIHYRH